MNDFGLLCSFIGNKGIQVKKHLVAISLLSSFMLGGCGSGADDKGNATPSGVDKVVTVIDGYLHNASVYVDRNSDGMSDVSEFVSLTDVNGQVVIQNADAAYSLIAQINAGETSDADRFGILNRGYALTAAPESDVVTPFTTIASDQLISLSDIASELNISERVLAGDYVAMKASGNTDAIIAHALARSMTTLPLSEMSAEQTLLSLVTALPRIDAYINENGVESLDRVTLDLSSTGEIKEIYSSLTDLLGSSERWSQVSLNRDLYASEGIQFAEVDIEEKILTLLDSNEVPKVTDDYLIDGNTLLMAGGIADEFIVNTDKFAFVKTSGMNDLVVWSKVNLAFPFEPELVSTDDISGSTWSIISDDSNTNVPDIVQARLSFSQILGTPSGSVEIKENGNTRTEAYYVSTVTDPELGIVSPLTIELGEQDSPLRLVQVTEADGIKLMYETNRDMFMVLVQDGSLADSVVSQF